MDPLGALLNNMTPIVTPKSETVNSHTPRPDGSYDWAWSCLKMDRALFVKRRKIEKNASASASVKRAEASASSK